MREAGTVSRADGVNTAFIILQVEELAGLFFIQPVPFLLPFFIQPLRFEFVNCFSKMRGNPFQISRVKGRGHGLATIGAGKAVNAFEYLVVGRMKCCVNLTGIFCFQPLKKLSVISRPVF